MRQHSSRVCGFSVLEGLLGRCLFTVLLLQVDEIWELPDMMSVYCAVHKLCHQIQGSGDSLLVERWTRDREVVSLNPSRSGGKMFFSRVKFVH